VTLASVKSCYGHTEGTAGVTGMLFAMAAAGRPVASGVFAGAVPPRAATHPPSGPGAAHGRPVHDGMHHNHPAPHASAPPPAAHAFAPALAYVAPPPPPTTATAAFTVGPGGDIDVIASFDDALRSALASVGARWVPADRAWRLPLARLADADAAVRTCGVPVNIDSLPDVASRLLRCARNLRLGAIQRLAPGLGRPIICSKHMAGAMTHGCYRQLKVSALDPTNHRIPILGTLQQLQGLNQQINVRAQPQNQQAALVSQLGYRCF
jgi:hypothetical protein